MKKLLLFLLLITGLSNAQIVNIPDANFKAKLLSANTNNFIASDNYVFPSYPSYFIKIDSNNDGEIQVSEALQVKYLNVYNSNIVSLTGIEAFSNLEYLRCSNNQLSTLDLSQNSLLIDIDCSYNSLVSLNITQCNSVKILNCEENQLSAIDVSQNFTLEHFYCSYNPLPSLNINQNVNLITLVSGFCSLTNIDVSQNSNLVYLDLRVNSLVNLNVVSNTNLEHLIFSANSINTIDLSQNASLKRLLCSSNQFSSLDVSNNPNLEELNCSFNQFSTINVDQNTNLQNLNCSHNQLLNINVNNNNNLVILDCSHNQISSVNLTQNTSLTGLNCSSNQLTTLDLSQNAMLSLACGNNQLNTLFIKNGSLEGFISFVNNPNLQYICADEGQVASIQAQAGSAVMVSSYCSFTPGGNYNSVAGVVRFDMDNNGCDASDLMLPNSVRLNLTNGTVSSGTFPTTDGSYTLYTTTGNHTLSTLLENPTYFSITPISTTLSFPTLNNSVYNQEFCIAPVGVHPDVEIIIVPIEIARPGFEASYRIVYRNKGNQTQSGTIDFNYNDAVLSFLSATINPDFQSFDNLRWNYSNLLPFESRSFELILEVNAPTDIPAVNIGDLLNFTAIINPILGDELPLDNTFYFSQFVVGSYDPNNKVCLEGSVVSPTEIGDYLHYNINFENTGTFPATFVVVKDMIDTTKFDIATLQVLNASHQMETRIAGNKVEFIFDDINLGTNQHGNVVFKIKTKVTLVEGNTVTNNANIYFDYNFPIETNTTSTTFQVLSNGEFPTDRSIVIAPNPTKNNVNINCNNTIRSIQLFDVQGRVLMTQLVNDSQSSIDISNYTNGIYFVKVLTDEGSKVERISKE